MKIAVLLGGVGYDSQKRMLNGILDGALLDGTEVYVFTSEGWGYGPHFKYEKGEYNIYNLPDFSFYDGVIVNSDTIHDSDIVNSCIRRIIDAGVPCISMNIKWDGAVCINLENRFGIRAIAEHLVQVHGVRSIYYISGPSDNQDADDRLQAYKDIMDEYHLGRKEDYIFYGDYTYQSGAQAIEFFLHMDRPLPDAIMAANDRMAIGAVRALLEAGYLVPEDVIVTGYDDSEMAALNHPRLTTVRRGEYAAGEMAYKKLKQIWNNGGSVEDGIVYGKLIFSESCGCERRNFYTHAELQELYVQRQLEVDNSQMLLKALMAEFTEIESFEDLLVVLEKYVRMINPEYFYLCTNGSREQYFDELEQWAAGQEQKRDTSTYMDNIWVYFAYEKGVVRQYKGYDKKLILPPDCEKGASTNFYVVLPLHHQDYCFGYCVIGNYRPIIDKQLLQHFVLNLSNAMESVHRQDIQEIMKKMLKR